MRRQNTLLLLSALFSPFVMAASASAQTQVQLPTFNFTTVTTTVVVPDLGQTYLGGIQRAQDGRTQFGVPLLSKLPGLGRGFGNAGIGQTRGATSLSVTAQIHDFEAMDQALLGQSSAQYGGALAGPAAHLPSRPTGAQAVMSVAEAQRTRAEEADSQRLDVANFLQRAQAAEADGRPNVAKIYYRIVARDTQDPAMRAVAHERLAALSGRGPSKLAATAPH